MMEAPLDFSMLDHKPKWKTEEFDSELADHSTVSVDSFVVPRVADVSIRLLHHQHDHTSHLVADDPTPKSIAKQLATACLVLRPGVVMLGSHAPQKLQRVIDFNCILSNKLASLAESPDFFYVSFADGKLSEGCDELRQAQSRDHHPGIRLQAGRHCSV